MSNETEKHCMCGCIHLESDCPNCKKVTDPTRIEEQEAKLAKVDKVLQTLKDRPYYRLPSPQDIARTTLAELKGENDDR